MTGKLIGAILGLLLMRNPWGLLIGLVIGHFYDQAVAARGRPRGSSPLEIGQKFFAATFEVMGHVAKSDGRVSEAEIAAARKVMADFRLDGAQIHAAIAHFTRGKKPDFDLDETLEGLRAATAHVPNLTRAFLEIQVRAALEGVDMKGPAQAVIRRIAERLEIGAMELAHIEQVLRFRREQFRAHARNGGSSGPQAAPGGMQLSAAYQVLEVDAKASDDEVAKAYRRQLSKHHPDKLKANGLPESMLEHAKERTQQIIEAYELIKSSRQR